MTTIRSEEEAMAKVCISNRDGDGGAVREALFFYPPPPGAICAVHDLPTMGLAREIVERARAAHHHALQGHGGLTVCRHCVERARRSLPPKAGG